MFTVNDVEYKIHPLKFKRYFDLEHLNTSIKKSTDAHDSTKTAHLICKYVNLSSDCPLEILESAGWKDVAVAFVSCLSEHLLTFSIPLFHGGSQSDKRDPWDYDQREWFAYSHLFAQSYGWTLDYIADLDVEAGIKMLQEILVSRQLDREWQWNLSDRCFVYEPESKSSRYQALDRPQWMMEPVHPPKKIKMPMKFLPQGLVIKPDGNYVINE